jgi:hypothetical protein
MWKNVAKELVALWIVIPGIAYYVTSSVLKLAKHADQIVSESHNQ